MISGLLAAVLALSFVSRATEVQAEEGGEFGLLHVAPGVEETWYTCTACHSERIIAQQGLVRQDWEEVFYLMVKEHGMSEIEEPDRSVILDYLTDHYNRNRPHFPSE